MAQKVTVIAVNGSGGAAVAVDAHTFSRYVEIEEEGPEASRQGLAITWPDGTTAKYAPLEEPVCIGNKGGAKGGGAQPLVGVPVYQVPDNTATRYCTVKSLTVTATSIILTEYN